MGNFEILILFLIVMYVLFVIARRLWPKRSNDERTTAPFVKRRQLAMIWTTVWIGVACVVTLAIWQVPEALPDRLETRQHWSIQGSQGRVSVRGEGSDWIGPFSQVDAIEPLSIEFSRNQQTVHVSRESASAPWVDESGTTIDAAEVIGRLGADAELTDLVRATLNESWVDGGLLQRAQSVGFAPANPFPTQPELHRIISRSHRSFGIEMVVTAIQIVWVVAGLLVVAGLGFDRWRFKHRQPAATLPA